MPSSIRTPLIESARKFIRKSTGTTVLVIAPLATVTMAPESQAATVFELPRRTSGGFSNGSATTLFESIGGPFEDDLGISGSNLYGSNLPEANGIVGLHQGFSSRFTVLTSGDGTGTLSFFFGGGVMIGDPFAPGSSVPVEFGFDLSAIGSGALSVDRWTITSVIESGFNSESGSGTGSFSGGFDVLSNSRGNEHISFITVDFSGAVSGDTVSVTTQGSGQGLSYNAVPEPSSTLMLGLGALVLGYRRKRA